MMGALDVPTTGGVRINFQELSEMNPKELTQFRSQTVGFVFQKFNLIPNLSALENVSIAMESTKMNRQERRSRACRTSQRGWTWQADEPSPDNFQVVNSSEFPLPEHWRITRRSSMQTNPQGRSTQRRVGQSSNCLTESEETSPRPSLLSHTIIQLQSIVIEL